MANFGTGRRSRPFNRDRSDSDRGSRFSRPRSGGFRDRNSGRPEMHEVICSKCGKTCKVPFKPTGSKPVFCSSCFEQSGGSNRNSRDFDRSRSFDKPSQYKPQHSSSPQTPQKNDSEQLNQINAKLDKMLKILQELEMCDDSEEDSDENSED